MKTQEEIAVPRGQLTKWREVSRALDIGAQNAYLAVQTGNTLAAGVPVADKLREVFEGAGQLSRSISQTIGPDMESLPDMSTAIPLDQLDTPDTRRLLDLLTEALAVAERVDAARGRSVGLDVPLGPSDPAGCDLAEAVALIRLRVKEEVFGPGEAVTGARE